ATTVPITANQVGAFSVAHVVFGPFKEKEICRPINGSKSQLEDNFIRTMFSFGSTLFVCGTARCGICTGFLATDLTKQDYVPNSRPFDPVNVVATRQSSYAFLSHPRDPTRRTLYVASAYVGRNLSIAVPFLSS